MCCTARLNWAHADQTHKLSHSSRSACHAAQHVMLAFWFRFRKASSRVYEQSRSEWVNKMKLKSLTWHRIHKWSVWYLCSELWTLVEQSSMHQFNQECREMETTVFSFISGCNCSSTSSLRMICACGSHTVLVGLSVSTIYTFMFIRTMWCAINGPLSQYHFFSGVNECVTLFTNKSYFEYICMGPI